MMLRLSNELPTAEDSTATTPSESHPSGPTATRHSRALQSALAAGHAADVLRELRRIDAELAPLTSGALKNAVGQDTFAGAVRTCARMPCPYCRKGFVTCAKCAGHGRTDGWIACASCSTLGAVACDFCGGSALAAYDFFPPGLRRHVALDRVRRAARHVNLLINNIASCRDGHNPRVEFHRNLELYGAISRCRATLMNFDDATGPAATHAPAAPVPDLHRVVAGHARRAGEALACVVTAIAAASRCTASAITAGDESHEASFFAGRAESLNDLADRFRSSKASP